MLIGRDGLVFCLLCDPLLRVLTEGIRSTAKLSIQFPARAMQDRFDTAGPLVQKIVVRKAVTPSRTRCK